MGKFIEPMIRKPSKNRGRTINPLAAAIPNTGKLYDHRIAQLPEKNFGRNMTRETASKPKAMNLKNWNSPRLLESIAEEYKLSTVVATVKIIKATGMKDSWIRKDKDGDHNGNPSKKVTETNKVINDPNETLTFT
jgi:hypothetical protein